MNTPPTDDALRLIPQDLSRVVESVVHVYQGNHDHLPELLNHAGTLVLKMGRRLSTSQLLIIGGLLTVGALLVIRQVTDDDDDDAAADGWRAAHGDKPGKGAANGGDRAKADTGDRPMSARSGEHRAASEDKP